jgi:hypothetical protein
MSVANSVKKSMSASSGSRDTRPTPMGATASLPSQLRMRGRHGALGPRSLACCLTTRAPRVSTSCMETCWRAITGWSSSFIGSGWRPNVGPMTGRSSKHPESRNQCPRQSAAISAVDPGKDSPALRVLPTSYSPKPRGGSANQGPLFTLTESSPLYAPGQASKRCPTLERSSAKRNNAEDPGARWAPSLSGKKGAEATSAK